ncbi:hypothetical protein CpB0002 [Chlamydia pneumoniae TW-183]|uniref:Uncharacterized protein n=2 Tax=Chlamydia pneumoniae TaxID=83558 RepID=A0ABN3YP99_CHLPN|nr:hypothetical protein CP_0774 [Chlamydia pneumoniae AR39]AAP97935.1 hypothetical protein CpB0002 [Chlamydia pneumoniae TW-183]ACZ32977.1 hypothetical protein CPK_ORF00502 [Chlamydia pneumoniae LPCoLN]ETR79868.1 hypothetical protein X556_0809 [Chlamydia pneumoniae B21]
MFKKFLNCKQLPVFMIRETVQNKNFNFLSLDNLSLLALRKEHIFISRNLG